MTARVVIAEDAVLFRTGSSGRSMTTAHRAPGTGVLVLS